MVASLPLRAGAEGVVSPGLMFIDRADHEWVRGEPVLLNLTDAPEPEYAMVPVIMMEIRVGRKGRKTPLSAGGAERLPDLPYREIFIEAPPSEWGRIGIGLRDFTPRRGLLKGLLYIEPFREIWENPFITSVERITTQSTTYGISGKWEGIRRTGFSMAAGLEYTNIRNDQLHSAYPTLGRTGSTFALEAAYTIKASGKFSLKPALKAVTSNFTGKASNYSSTEPNISLKYESGNLEFGLRAFACQRSYAEADPIFFRKRSDSIAGASLVVVLGNLMDNQNLSLTLGGSTQRADSNIAFFDTSSDVTYITVGLRI